MSEADEEHQLAEDQLEVERAFNVVFATMVAADPGIVDEHRLMLDSVHSVHTIRHRRWQLRIRWSAKPPFRRAGGGGR